VVQIDDRTVVRGQMRDLVSKELSRPIQVDLDTASGVDRTYVKASHFFHFIPNALGIDITAEDMAYKGATGETVHLYPSDNEAWWKQGLGYLSAVSVTNLPSRRYGRAPRWQFTFAPLFRVSDKRVVTHGLPTLQGQVFDRWWVSAGYGPELGYQFSRHYLYVQIFYTGAWSEISWRRSNQDYSITRTFFSADSEVGYAFFVNQSWVVRLFGRTLNEDTEGWAEALSKGTPLQLEKGGQTQVAQFGLSVAYRFEPTWRRRE
jgi:hypothetical protein